MPDIRIDQSRLKEDRGEIRLLNLLAGSRESPVQCTLVVRPLWSAASYDALSYTWGDPTTRSNIYVNGLSVSVTSNLERALRRLRHENTDRTLWIDALCINQEDFDERSQQVGMMGQIYATATTVLIWIGEADDLSDIAFDMMSMVAHGYMDEIVSTKVCSFYLNLGSRPWFNRVWIIQELALATQDPVVCCGKKAVGWSLFMSAWSVLSERLFAEIGMTKSKEISPDGSARSTSETVASTKIDSLNNIRASFTTTRDAKLHQLYIYSRTSEATEPRDRIYGLLGLLNEDDRRDLQIDYRKSVATVFADAMAHIFAKGDGPFFLASMWLHGGKSPILGLPSWVLDFTRQTAEKAGHPGSISFHPASPMSASGAGAGAKNGRVSDDGRVLQVEALPVDVVSHTLVFDQDVGRCIQQLRDVEVLVAQARSSVIQEDILKPYYEQFRSSEPIWSVLISGKRYLSGYDQAPASYGEAYTMLLDQRERTQDGSGGRVASEDAVDEYRRCLSSQLPGRTFFTTCKGFSGLGQAGVCSGDSLTIWFGAPTPFVTRSEVGSVEDKCRLIGVAYVGGIMNGELVDELYCEGHLDSKALFVV